MKRRWKIILPVLALLLGLILYAAYRDFGRVESGENLPRVSWLPESATNICFYKSYGFTAFEFDISEQDFLKWASERQLKKLDGEEFGISRYHLGLKDVPPAGDPPGIGAPKEELNAYFAAEQKHHDAISKVIRRGYGYRLTRSNGGGHAVAYDLETGRAYYTTTPR